MVLLDTTSLFQTVRNGISQMSLVMMKKPSVYLRLLSIRIYWDYMITTEAGIKFIVYIKAQQRTRNKAIKNKDINKNRFNMVSFNLKNLQNNIMVFIILGII